MANLENILNIKKVETADGTYTLNATYLNDLTLEEVIARAKSEGSFSHFKVVTTLPTTGIDTNVIYLVASVNGTGDSYDEYIYVNSAWEKIGNTDINLVDETLNTSAPSNNATSSAGSTVITTSEAGAHTATGTISMVYKQSATATGSTGGTTTKNTSQTGNHSHTFTGAAATISVDVEGSAASAGGHTHGVSNSTATVVATVSGTTDSINAAPTATGSAGGHTHSITPSTISISSAPSATGAKGDHAHTVTVDSHGHGADVTALASVSANTTSIYQITGVGSKPTGTDVTALKGVGADMVTLAVDGNVLKLFYDNTKVSTVTATKMTSYGSTASRSSVTVATGVTSTTVSAAAPGSAATLTATCSTTGSHTHAISGTAKTVVSGITVTDSAGGHTHGITGVAKTVVTAVSSTTASVLTGVTVDSAGAHTHSVSASGSTTYTPAGTLSSTGNHSHTYVELKAHTHSIALTDTTITDEFSCAIGNHTHTVTVGNHTHSLNNHTHTYLHVKNSQDITTN